MGPDGMGRTPCCMPPPRLILSPLEQLVCSRGGAWRGQAAGCGWEREGGTGGQPSKACRSCAMRHAAAVSMRAAGPSSSQDYSFIKLQFPPLGCPRLVSQDGADFYDRSFTPPAAPTRVAAPLDAARPVRPPAAPVLAAAAHVTAAAALPGSGRRPPCGPAPASVWMRTVYSCAVDVHISPAATLHTVSSSSSGAYPITSGSCTAGVDVQPPSPSSTTASRCHMGLMNSLQLERLIWALSKLSRGQSPPSDWKQVGWEG